MSEQIFRQKSIDKVKSPESLDDYIQVSNPGIWLLLISIIVLLVGACVWGIFGHIDSTVPATVTVENGETVCFIEYGDLGKLGLDPVGHEVKFAGEEATIMSITEKSDLGYKCELSSVPGLADGIYEGEVIVESFKPISFVLN